jgi:glutathione S-transferase
MAIEIFWGSGSGPSWRVLLTLAVKGVPYESRLLSFSKGEHKSDEIVAMSPRGKVPVLRDGAFSLCESLAIMTYLDRRFPSPPLFGETPEEAGQILRAIMTHECYALAELSALEADLASRPFLATPTLSAADLFVYPQVKTFERALGKPGADTLDHELGPLPAVFPRLAAWCARIEALPGYEATFPPHWREG